MLASTQHFATHLSDLALFRTPPAEPPLEGLADPLDQAPLTPAQLRALASLADGRDVSAAARAASVHRCTVHAWLRSSPEFRACLATARARQLASATELATLARNTLRDLLADPAAKPELRLRAALAVLKAPTLSLALDEALAEAGPAAPEPPAPKSSDPFKTLLRNALASADPLPRPAPSPAVAATPRSAPCPCGSGLKFKRCCGKTPHLS